jgi:5-methylcytosine-specific restriction enzyme A
VAWRKEHKSPEYGRAAWKRARAAAMARAGGRCEIRGPGCAGAAVSVDHVFGLAADPSHRFLQCACKPCHDAKTSGESNRGHREPPATPRTQW